MLITLVTSNELVLFVLVSRHGFVSQSDVLVDEKTSQKHGLEVEERSDRGRLIDPFDWLEGLVGHMSDHLASLGLSITF